MAEAGSPLAAKCMQCPTGRGHPPGREVKVRAVYTPALRPADGKIPAKVALLMCGHFQPLGSDLEQAIERHPAGRRRGW